MTIMNNHKYCSYVFAWYTLLTHSKTGLCLVLSDIWHGNRASICLKYHVQPKDCVSCLVYIVYLILTA